MLVAALLMGGAGGAVAVADPDSSGSTAHGDDGTNASGQQSSTDAEKPEKKEPSGTHSKDGTLGGQSGQQPPTEADKPQNEPGGTATTDGTLGGQSGQQPPTDAKKPKNEPGGTATQDETKDSGIVAAAPDPVAAPVPNAAAPAPTPAAPAPTAAAPAPTPAAPAPTPAAPAPTPAAPAPTAVAPDIIASIQDMLTPVAGAVVPLTQLQSDLYSFLMSSDVSALVQDMLTSVAGAVVPLTQLQSDLYSFLLGIAGMEPAAGLGGLAGAGLSPAADASMVSQWRLVLSLAAILGQPLAGNATGIGALGGIAASTLGATSQADRALSPPGMAPLLSNGVIPMGVRSVFQHTYSELSELPLPVAISLSALFAVALPGVGGLVIISLAGVRVGYRQAKAGFALHTEGIARFAHPGAVPLAVVRSGSLVVVRPRALRVVRPGAFSGGCLLDKVA